MKTIRLATRGSPLAMKQTEMVREFLETSLTDVEIEIVKISTTGDTRQGWSLEREGGVGLFTKELESALLEDRADVAVHSAKDLPSENPSGLRIMGYLPREQAHDVLVVREGCREPSFIATSSPRRRAQTKRMFPKAVWSEIRGNVDTRLKKVASAKVDATFLAAAGLRRLGIDSWPGVVFKPLDIRQMVPAGGQGAIALECRQNEYLDLSPMFDSETARALKIERFVLSELGVGCHSSFAVHYYSQKLLLYHDEWESAKSFKFKETEEEAIIKKIKEIIEELEFSSTK